MRESFVHLHVHTEFSLLDGASRIKDLVKQACAWEMPALAITDHGVMFGVVDFYEECTAAGIKPIIGCEAYLAPRTRFDKESRHDASLCHLLLLCENDEGYRNLIKLVSKSHLEGFYYKPRVDKELLQEHSKGLIATSACLSSPVCRALLSDDYESAKRWAQELRDIFGKQNFFLELQDHGLEGQKKVNPGLLRLAEELKIPLIAANDVHYVRKEDAPAQRILLKINTGAKPEEKGGLTFETEEFYLKSPQEMAQTFSHCPVALHMSSEISERCSVKLNLGEPQMPDYEVPEGYTPDTYLRKLCAENLPRRYPNASDEVKRRLDYELSVIASKGYSGYFLIVWDIVRHAKEKGILVGPGRGSAAGCMVSYLLGIVDIDPLRYGLMFERFLNPERKSSPDIDLDFPDNRRDEIIAYVKHRYGEDRVAQIVTFGTLEARAAVRDAGRALGFTPKEVDEMAKLIPMRPSWRMSIEEALERVMELQERYRSDEKIRQWLDTAKAIEGLARHASRHPCGVVIGNRPLIELVPLMRTHDGSVITQYDGTAVEKIGLVKMDFLGLSTTSIIGRTVELVKENKGIEIDIANPPLDDAKTYAMLSKGDSSGVFQLESSGMKQLLRDLQPERFEHIVPLVALYRPGPMNEIDRFVGGRHGKEIHYIHPALEPILKETFGVMLYQEQVMRIAHELAGFTIPQAEILMRAMGKKRVDLMESMREKFIKGAVERGIDRQTAHKVWERMEAFAHYAFNKSHSAAYGFVAYQTAYLKANFPVEYMTAFLSAYKNKKDKFAVGLEECRRMGIRLLLPDINKSHKDFSVENGSIRFGLSAIKNVGEATIDAIISARTKGGPFKDIFDFIERVPSRVATKSTLESLIKAGAFDTLHPARKPLLEKISKVIDHFQKARHRKSAGQTSLFGAEEAKAPVSLDGEETSREEKLQWERELLGVFVSDHPLMPIWEQLRQRATSTIEALKELKDRQKVVVGGLVTSIKPITTKDNRPMMFVTLEDLTGEVEVVVFPDVYEACSPLLQKDKVVWVEGAVSLRAEEGNGEDSESFQVKVICRKVTPFAEEKQAGRLEGSKASAISHQPSAISHQPIVHVYVPADKANREVLTALQRLLREHQGELPVEVTIKDDAMKKRIALGVRVDGTDELKQKLEALLGEGCVQVS